MLLALRSLWEHPAGVFRAGVIIATQVYGGPTRAVQAATMSRAVSAVSVVRSQSVPATVRSQVVTAPRRTVRFDE